MERQIVENFKKNGIRITNDMTSGDLADKLGASDVGTLKNILNEFYTEDDLPDVTGDEFVQTLTYSHALLHAFDYELDSIEASDIEAAHRKALKYVETLNGEEEPEVEVAEESAEETQETQEAEETETAPVTQKVSKKSIVEALIDANPDATAHEIVEMAVSQNPDTMKESTARMYFYNIRNERGLAPNGKRGRRPNDTADRVKEILSNNPDMPRTDVIQLIMSELGLTESTSSQYYSKANTALKGE